MNYNSQVGQDKWVHSVVGNKQDGFFVELGACDGVEYSNTLFFEKQLGWKGICIEPNDEYYSKLLKNRSSMNVNELAFSEAGHEVDFSCSEAASGIVDENIGPFTRKDKLVKKKTTTLGAILDACHAPSIMDYLSLDVEGQEYNILKTFPFDKYKFRCMTVEHNAPHIGTTQQMLIRDILEKNGYQFVKGNDDIHQWGHGPIDDFYVHPQSI